FSSRRRHTRSYGDWSSDVCSSDLTENMTTGTNESTGPDPDRPRADVPQPQWKTAFSAPRPAPTDSRFMTEATSGMSRLRNTTVRSEEHTSELQSPYDLVCRLLLEK